MAQVATAVDVESNATPTPFTTPPSSGIIVHENTEMLLNNTDAESVGSQHSIVRMYEGRWSLICNNDNTQHDLTTLERYATLLTWRNLNEQELEHLLDNAKSELEGHEFRRLLQIVAIARSCRLLSDDAPSTCHNNASSSHL